MKEILVFADWVTLPEMAIMGILRSEKSKGAEVFSFEYDKKWLENGFAQAIDPDLKLFTGPQYLSDEKPNFGIFLDSSPDRWGRTLMERREAILARQTKKSKKRLSESDFLLGLSDETRMGALRFKVKENGNFLNDNLESKVPPITSIRELEQASLKLENDNFFEDKEAQKWLSMLINPGSSLGGARPKANVRDTKGNLWIAKFPSKNDDKNIGAWEFVVNKMAKKLGLDVAEVDAKKYTQKQHTFLTKRFDRNVVAKVVNRIHFASAMTLLGYKDGYDHKEGGSYLEIVEFIEQFGAEPDLDIRELWKRIVFSVAVSNTDDHLRNHGFLLAAKGWKLSPAYDINPNEKGTGLSLNISEEDNSLDFELCMEVCKYFRLKKDEANAFIIKTKKVVSQWKKFAVKMKISKTEQVFMESAFARNVLTTKV